MRVTTCRIDVPQPSSVRAPGLHVMDVIRDMALHVGLLDPHYREEELEGSPDARRRDLRFALGHAWEGYVASWLNAIHAPGELVVDGLAMNCDFIDPATPRIWDTKATWQSCGELRDNGDGTWTCLSRPVDAMWIRLMQLKVYGYGYGTEWLGAPITSAGLLVYHVRGDYRDNWPECLQHEVEFTRREVEEAWEGVVRHSEEMRRR